VTGREALKILQDGWIQVVQLRGNDEDLIEENIKAQEAFAYIIELLKQKDETILDKIRDRVELEKLGYPPSAGYYKAIVKVLQILDKHKAESEEDEDDRS